MSKQLCKLFVVLQQYCKCNVLNHHTELVRLSIVPGIALIAAIKNTLHLLWEDTDGYLYTFTA